MALPSSPHAPEILRCTGTADFLAALPRLTGFTAPGSAFLVLFTGRRAHSALRLDLPDSDSPTDSRELLDLISDAVRTHAELSTDPGQVYGRATVCAPAIVISSAQSFEDAGGIPWLRLAKRLERRLRRDGIEVRELCCIAPDGWASYLVPGDRRHPLSEISASPVAAPEPTPTLDSLGEIPADNPARCEAVAQWLTRLEPLSAAGAPAAADGKPTHRSWASECRAIGNALAQTQNGPSPALTARLTLAAEHPRLWLLILFEASGRFTRTSHPGNEHGDDVGDELSTDPFATMPISIANEREAAFDASPCWSIERALAILAEAPCDPERLHRLRRTLLTAVASVPQRLRPGLLALSAWAWWMSGNQSVARKHAALALEIEPQHALSRTVQRLSESHAASMIAHFLRGDAEETADSGQPITRATRGLGSTMQ